MALSNAQYDEIMRGYQARQLANRHLSQERHQELITSVPEIESVEIRMADLSIQAARQMLSGDPDALALLKKELADLREHKAKLLADHHYPSDYLDPVYTCPDCKDTGYIEGAKCHCFTQQIINTVYAQSNIRKVLEKENFSTFSYKYYSDDIHNPTTGMSALDTAKQAVDAVWDFVNDFDNKPKNLFFYGNTGVGKTFLSNCAAKELLEQGKSVIYFTAFQLFDILSKGVFDRDADAIAANRNIFECDLLIIDDLGTELSNAFTTSQLFLCVNERILRNKSTIISSNLSPIDILETYSERTFSRISDNYTIIHLFGDDIRIQKRK